MDVWKFIKPDRKVMSAFSILLLLSVIGSFFILGHPGHLYYEAGCGYDFGYVRGIGLPLGWADMHFGSIPGYTGNITSSCYHPPVPFDPINFVLDLIFWYVVALLILRGYDKLKKEPKRKKRK